MNLSIIEFLVYGGIAYFSLAMLIISIIQKPELATGSQSLIKSVYILPGIVCMFVIAFASPVITISDNTVTTTADSIYEVLDNTNAVTVLNSTVAETVNTYTTNTLLNSVWGIMHVMFAMIMVVFVITKILQLLGLK